MSSIRDYAKEISDYADRHNLMNEDAAFFQRLVREALRDERERAAKIAENKYASAHWHPMFKNAAVAIATAIREDD